VIGVDARVLAVIRIPAIDLERLEVLLALLVRLVLDLAFTDR